MDIMHTYYYYTVPLYAINVVGLLLTVNTPYIYRLRCNMYELVCSCISSSLLFIEINYIAPS